MYDSVPSGSFKNGSLEEGGVPVFFGCPNFLVSPPMVGIFFGKDEVVLLVRNLFFVRIDSRDVVV